MKMFRALVAALAFAFAAPVSADIIGAQLVNQIHPFAFNTVSDFHFTPNANEMVEFSLTDLEFPKPLIFSAFVIHQGPNLIDLGIGPSGGVPPNPVKTYFHVSNGLPYEIDVMAAPQPQFLGFNFGTYRAEVQVVPEASTLAMMSLGAFALMGWVRLKRGGIG